MVKKFNGIIMVDLDGTLAEYNGEWDANKIGKPIPKAKSAIAYLRSQKYYVMIWTARDNKTLVENWLKENKIIVDELMLGKPINKCIIDDRAIRFEGNWSKTLGQILNFEPWWKLKDKSSCNISGETSTNDSEFFNEE